MTSNNNLFYETMNTTSFGLFLLLLSTVTSLHVSTHCNRSLSGGSVLCIVVCYQFICLIISWWILTEDSTLRDKENDSKMLCLRSLHTVMFEMYCLSNVDVTDSNVCKCARP
jgi:hypothetical protein